MSTAAPQHHRGERLGLPADGPGSLAPTGTRVLALLVDCVAAALVAALFVRHLPRSWSLIPLAVDYVVGLSLGGQTRGMPLFRLRVVRVDRRDTRLAPVGAAVRTVLLFALIPALIMDRDARGMHDRVVGTAVVRA